MSNTEIKYPINPAEYKIQALSIYQNESKLHAIKFIWDNCKGYFSLRDCKKMIETWIQNKEYTTERQKLSEYDKLLEDYCKVQRDNKELRLSLEHISNSFWSENEPFEERFYYLKNKAKEALNNIKINN